MIAYFAHHPESLCRHKSYIRGLLEQQTAPRAARTDTAVRACGKRRGPVAGLVAGSGEHSQILRCLCTPIARYNKKGGSRLLPTTHAQPRRLGSIRRNRSVDLFAIPAQTTIQCHCLPGLDPLQVLQRAAWRGRHVTDEAGLFYGEAACASDDRERRVPPSTLWVDFNAQWAYGGRVDRLGNAGCLGNGSGGSMKTSSTMASVCTLAAWSAMLGSVRLQRSWSIKDSLRSRATRSCEMPPLVNTSVRLRKQQGPSAHLCQAQKTFVLESAGLVASNARWLTLSLYRGGRSSTSSRHIRHLQLPNFCENSAPPGTRFAMSPPLERDRRTRGR